MGRGNLRKRKAEDAEDEGAGEGAAEEDADTLCALCRRGSSSLPCVHTRC